jgi:microcompartment protein CcmL/EutN
MPQAVGSLETKGFPPVLAAADAMVKAGRVTLIGYLRAGSARFCVNIRGDVSEVKAAMAAGVEAAENTPGGVLETWVIIPRPSRKRGGGYAYRLQRRNRNLPAGRRTANFAWGTMR